MYQLSYAFFNLWFKMYSFCVCVTKSLRKVNKTVKQLTQFSMLS